MEMPTSPSSTGPMNGDAAGMVVRVLTCGGVGCGKSTFIARLLDDGDLVQQDPHDAIRNTDEANGMSLGGIDCAPLINREQYATNADAVAQVACRHISTPARNFLIFDVPGGARQSRAMVAAASRCDLAILFVDASVGLSRETMRHACIVRKFGIRNVVLAVNKMDAVEFAEKPFVEITETFDTFAEKLNISSVTAVPLSALQRENITEQSGVMPWYDGPTLLQHLEAVDADTHAANKGFRMAVQAVESANESLPTIEGRILSGNAVVGDGVVILPSARTSRVADVRSGTKGSAQVGPGDAVMMKLADDIEAVPGDVICAAKKPTNGGGSVLGQPCVVGR